MDTEVLDGQEAPLRICGVPDHWGTEAIIQFPTKSLTWTITDELPGVSYEDYRDAAAFAWRNIMLACGVKLAFTANARTAHIRMGAGRIDGPSGTLAWSELGPGGKGWAQQKYDTSELWYAGTGMPPRGKISLPAVIGHEGCHALGLPHGGNDLMKAMYDPSNLVPGTWTINELVRRYGRAVPLPDEPTAPPAPLPPQGGRPVDPETSLEKVKRVLDALEMMAKTFTPWTTVDDNAVAFMKRPLIMRMIAFLIAELGVEFYRASDAKIVAALEKFKVEHACTLKV